MDDWRHGGFGLYIHWPFCEAKCPYCDFNSHVAASIDQERWCNAYLTELDRVADALPGRVLNSVFFGGGTPSLMDPDTIARVLERVGARWVLANDIEITLEANPSSVEANRFAAFAGAGVNRVSLGVQALNDADLKRLGRLHSSDEALRAIDIAQSTFNRVSFDLIYARQDQSLPEWQEELQRALALGTEHLSLYQLTIEPGTAFGWRHARGGLGGLPDEDLAADLYEATQDICDAAGRVAYETSNHAVVGAESRHNLIYWRSGDYAGIGPGAHGRVTIDGHRYATDTALAPGAWLKAVETTGSGEQSRVSLSGTDRAEEFLMFGLRLIEGIDLRRYRALAGDDLNPDRTSEMVDLGLLVQDGFFLRTTQSGRPVLNAILRKLLV